MVAHKFLASLFFTLVFSSTIQAMSEEQFKNALASVLTKSSLPPTQKAKHILNRMGYGGNPRSRKQRLDQLKTNDAIINFITEQFKNVSATAPTDTTADEIFALSFHWDPKGTCETAKKFNLEVNIYNYCRDGLYDFKDLNARTDLTKKLEELTSTYNAAKAAFDQAVAKKVSASVIKDLNEKLVTARINLSGFNGRSFGALKNRQVARALLDEDRAFRNQLFDFWFNHFSVSVEKIGGMRLKPYISLIEQNMTGSFHDLLSATAHSPGMLLFLDNFVSGRNRLSIIQQAQSQAMNQCRPGVPGGIPACTRRVVAQVLKDNVSVNENYARELIELHTFGQGPGVEYGQNAVERSAKILSGWSVNGDNFYFNPNFHVRGNKRLFMKPTITIPDGGPGEAGQSEGEALLRHLADHPATAENISKKLVRRFVSEDSAFTAPLVNQMEQEYLRSRGNLTNLYQLLFSSAEFWSFRAYRSKAVRPLDFHVRVARALGISDPTVTPNTPKATQQLEKSSQMDRLLAIARNIYFRAKADGQDLFSCSPPTGFADDSNTWGSVGSVFSNAFNGFKIEEVAFHQWAYTVSNPVFGSTEPKDAWLWKATYHFLLDNSPMLLPNTLNSLSSRFDFELLTGKSLTAGNLYTVPVLDQIRAGRDFYLLPIRTQLSLHFGSEEASRY